MSDTEARTTDGATTGSTETRGEASSAAERLGGPLEDEQSPDTASEAEVGADRRSDAGDERRQSSDTARDADVDADRPTEAAASEGEDRSSDHSGSRHRQAMAPRRSSVPGRHRDVPLCFLKSS